MKKILDSLLFLLLLASVTACKSDLDALEDGNHRTHRVKEKPMVKTIRMSFGGDYITESEEPLLRAEDGDTYVAINVFRTEKNVTDAVQEKYAYGFFKGLDAIQVDLVTGYTYTFEASILIEDKDKTALYNKKYDDPFRLDENDGVELSTFIKEDNNKTFIYHSSETKANNRKMFSQLEKGRALVRSIEDVNNTTQAKYMRYPRVKRFYGKLENVDPTNNASVELPMQYKSFGLRFVLEQIPDGTYLTVKDVTKYQGSQPNDESEDSKYLKFPSDLTLGKNSENVLEWDGIYSLNNLKVDSKSFTLEFTWHKLSGSPETFTHTFEVNAKKKKILKLNIEGDAGEITETKTGNITFAMSDSWDEMGTDYEESVTNNNSQTNQ